MTFDAATITVIAGAVVTVAGAFTAMAVAIIRALKENTAEVQKGNEQAAVADAQKIALSARIAEPFTPDPMEERLKRIEKMLTERSH